MKLLRQAKRLTDRQSDSQRRDKDSQVEPCCLTCRTCNLKKLARCRNTLEQGQRAQGKLWTRVNKVKSCRKIVKL